MIILKSANGAMLAFMAFADCMYIPNDFRYMPCKPAPNAIRVERINAANAAATANEIIPSNRIWQCIKSSKPFKAILCFPSLYFDASVL